MHQLRSYADFIQLPQARAFYQKHRQQWNASRHRAIATPSVIEAFSPIDGAAQGVKILSHYGTIRYYTARAPVVYEATHHWLEQYSFPQSGEIICCTSIEQKVLALSCHTPLDEPIVLIDDRGHTHFLTILERMKEKECVHHLVKRLTIVAFHASASALPATDLCPLLALACWNDLSVVLEQVLHNNAHRGLDPLAART